MATNLRRFTISITPKMEAELDAAKQRLYYRDTQNAMIRDLIIRGLAALKEEESTEKQSSSAFSKA